MFDSFEGVLICDNLEKLSNTDANTFLTEIVQTIPSNILFITTGDISEIDVDNLNKCYDIFDVLITIEKIDTVTELKTFIHGRMKTFSIKDKPKVTIDDETIKILLERTEGNIRECFRYCLVAIQKFKKDITTSLIKEAILIVDKPRFEVLDEVDRKIMNSVSSMPKASLKTIAPEVEEIGITALKNRLEKLVNSGLMRKNLEKKGRTHHLIFSVPNTIKGYFVTSE